MICAKEPDCIITFKSYFKTLDLYLYLFIYNQAVVWEAWWLGFFRVLLVKNWFTTFLPPYLEDLLSQQGKSTTLRTFPSFLPSPPLFLRLQLRLFCLARALPQPHKPTWTGGVRDTAAPVWTVVNSNAYVFIYEGGGGQKRVALDCLCCLPDTCSAPRPAAWIRPGRKHRALLKHRQ